MFFITSDSLILLEILSPPRLMSLPRPDSCHCTARLLSLPRSDAAIPFPLGIIGSSPIMTHNRNPVVTHNKHDHVIATPRRGNPFSDDDTQTALKLA